MINIIQKGNKILSTPTKKVSLDEIKSDKVQEIIKKMKDAMHFRDEGVAISANQIGEPLRIFIISGKIFTDPYSENYNEGDVVEDKIFINPELTKTSKDKVWLEEGCLSVENIFGMVERSKKATVRALDENGKLFTLGGSGLLAQIFQHEIDHLNGILFVDKAKNIQKINETKNQENKATI